MEASDKLNIAAPKIPENCIFSGQVVGNGDIKVSTIHCSPFLDLNTITVKKFAGIVLTRKGCSLKSRKKREGGRISRYIKKSLTRVINIFSFRKGTQTVQYIFTVLQHFFRTASLFHILLTMLARIRSCLNTYAKL